MQSASRPARQDQQQCRSPRLLSNTSWQQNGTIANILPDNINDLREKLNIHAKHRLTREIEFYKSQNKPAPETECQRIKAMLNEQPDAIYLQMAWGIGWRGMTGDWASNEQVEKFRELFKLGRPDKPFPKTRRLAVSGEPKYPLGWIRLLPYEKVSERLEKQQVKIQIHNSQSSWVNQTLAIIAQQNRSTEKETLRGKALAEAWQALSDGEEKKAALVDIKNRWQAEDWWEQPNGKSAKQAKAIYQQA